MVKTLVYIWEKVWVGSAARGRKMVVSEVGEEDRRMD